MNNIQAQLMADKINKHHDLQAKVVRILSGSLDPIRPDDYGWDVEIETGMKAYNVWAVVDNDLSAEVKARDPEHARELADDLELSDYLNDDVNNLRVTSVELA